MRPRLAAVLTAAALLAAPLPPATAEVTQPSGPPCGYVLARYEERVYVVTAGPVTVTDEDDPSVVHTASVTCSFIDDAAGRDHTVPPLASVSGPASSGAAVLAPAPVALPVDPFRIRLCTRLDVDGVPLYWHGPADRNQDGWWTPDPAATCQQLWEHTDLRADDPPLGQALSAAVTVLGEAEPAMPLADAAACALPPDVRDEVWPCGAPSTLTSISLVRLAGAGAVVRGLPSGWSCTDVRSGAPVTRGSALTVPDPGVSCDPAPGWTVACAWMQVSGALAPTTLGRVAVTSGCGSVTVTRHLVPAQGRLAELWSAAHGRGTPPWRCVTDEDTPAEPAYTLSCHLFGSVS